TRATTGSKIAIKIAMIAITTRSSTSVNPRRPEMPPFFITNSFHIRRPRTLSPSSDMNPIDGRPNPPPTHDTILPPPTLPTTTIPQRRRLPAFRSHPPDPPQAHGTCHP